MDNLVIHFITGVLDPSFWTMITPPKTNGFLTPIGISFIQMAGFRCHVAFRGWEYVPLKIDKKQVDDQTIGVCSFLGWCFENTAKKTNIHRKPWQEPHFHWGKKIGEAHSKMGASHMLGSIPKFKDSHLQPSTRDVFVCHTYVSRKLKKTCSKNLGSTPHTVPVTTRMISFLVENPKQTLHLLEILGGRVRSFGKFLQFKGSCKVSTANCWSRCKDSVIVPVSWFRCKAKMTNWLSAGSSGMLPCR